MGPALVLTFFVLYTLQMATTAGSDRDIVKLRPSSILVTEGGTIRFSCSPLIPMALPLLIMNGHPVTRSNMDPRLTYVNYFHDYDLFLGNRTFTFVNMRRGDNQTMFSCNIGPTPSNLVLVTVIVPPRLSGLSPYVTLLEGGSLTFMVDGVPRPSLAWWYNGQRFVGSERVEIRHGTSLVFKSTSRLDSGNYTLVATNYYGENAASLIVTVAYNKFLATPTDAMLIDGNTITNQCRHMFGRGYRWITRGPHSGNPYHKIRITNFGTVMTYGPVDYKDNGVEIVCVAIISADGRMFLSPPGRLTVHTPPHVDGVTPVVAIEGSHIQLKFIVEGEPAPTSYSFLYNNQLLIHSSTSAIALSDTSLVIENVSRHDAGRYSLVAANVLGMGSGTIVLKVQFSPKIHPLTGPIVAQVNRSISLACGQSIEGNPLPTAFTWVFHGMLVSGPDTSVELSSLATSLSGDHILPAVDYANAGLYTCTAANFIGNDSITVNLLVLDPPSPPQWLRLLELGSTWVRVAWEPPVNRSNLPLSGYRVTAFPQPSAGSSFILTSHSSGEVSGVTSIVCHQSEAVPMYSGLCRPSSGGAGNCSDVATASANASCVEVECVPLCIVVSADETMVRLSGLIPAVMHQLIVTATANGTNLESEPAHPVTFVTKNNVPGVDCVTARVDGPAAMKIQWSLAFSGGSTVQHFEIGRRKVNSSNWTAVANGRVGGQLRWLVAGGLEANQQYIFRVRAANEFGSGEYDESDPVLSHSIGVPSQPAQPQITGWGDNYAILLTSINNIGSPINFTFSLLLLDEGVVVKRRTFLLPNYTGSGDSISVSFPDLEFQGQYQFQAQASNFLGDSEYSVPSLNARSTVEEVNHLFVSAGIAVGTLMGALNVCIAIALAVFSVFLVKESHKNRRDFTRRAELAQTAVFIDEEQFSPRFSSVFRDSPDGGSNNLYIDPRRKTTSNTTYVLPSSVSSMTAV